MVAILGANSVSGGYEVSNSLRFNDDDGPELKRTPSSAGDRKTFTTSFWVKRGNLGTSQRLWSAGTSIGTNNNNVSSLLFETNDTLKFFGEISGSASFTLQTSQVFRDVSAWYHIVLAVDTTQSTSSNRVKIYVNGNQVTDFGTETYMSQDVNTFYNADNLNMLSYGGSGGKIDGYIAEFVNIDGTALTQTSFGEFDDNGVWIPIDVSGLDFSGTNSCHLEFKQTGTSQNSSGIGADTSGNDNHFAVSNLASTDITEDTCTNNFATLVPTLNMTLSEGNVKATTSRTSNWDGVHASIGVTSGKWYFETKASNAGGTFRVKSGVVGNPETFNILYNGRGTSDDPGGTLSNTFPSYGKGVWLSYWYDHNYNSSSTASSQSSGDILQFALDMDNYKMWIGVNGQFKDNSNNNVSYSDVASGSSATVTIPSGAYTGKTFFPDVWLRDDDGSFDNVAEVNFGNPSFSISSGNNDGKYGNFEYAVPSGFYALCTKRLAEFG